MRELYKLLSVLGDLRALFRGTYPKRFVRQRAHRGLARWMRKAKL